MDCGNGLGEGPLWCPVSQTLWWFDVDDPHLFCANGQGQLLNRWKLPKYPGSMALRENGSLLLMFRHGPAIFYPHGGTVEWLDMPGLHLGETRFNDGKCDRLGRFWSGTMDRRTERAIGSLYRMDGLQRIKQMDSIGVTIANGIAWSPDNRTMYFADTPTGCIYAYDHDLDRGEITHRRVFFQFKSGKGGPDGLTVDAQGSVWCAMFNRAELHHIAPSGHPMHVINLPVLQPTSVMFGGPDLGTLFITTARMHLSPAQIHNQPWAGHVLCFEPGVKGLPEPRCAF
jgi:sugar lactone lactonase YvrE